MQDISDAEMLGKIIDGSPIPSFVINKQHVVTHWNTAIEVLTGSTKEDIIGTDSQWVKLFAQFTIALGLRH
jgi:PAS domain S-box-containing protein